MTEKIVFFGLNRTAKEYAHIPYIEGKAFIAMKGDKGEARDDLFACISNMKVIVAILSDADLGRGAAIPKFYSEVEKLGCKVHLYEQNIASKKKPVSNSGLPVLTDKQTQQVCAIWAKGYLTETDRLAQIADLEGIPKLVKAQVYYICVTKAKRLAKRQQKK